MVERHERHQRGGCDAHGEAGEPLRRHADLAYQESWSQENTAAGSNVFRFISTPTGAQQAPHDPIDGAPEELAELAQRSLRRKRPALAEALTGRVTAHHRFLLAQLLHHIEFLDEAIATCDGRIATCTAGEAEAVARLETIPGVARRTAETIVAELGCDMTRFPTAGHAASWAGLCPGNHESAGKRLSGRARVANRTLRAALVESARGALRTRNCYLAAQYRRLVKRRGDKKAIVAVAHSILVIAYHVLRDSQSYRELGGDNFDRLNTDRLTRYHTKGLAALGYLVTLTKRAT